MGFEPEDIRKDNNSFDTQFEGGGADIDADGLASASPVAAPRRSIRNVRARSAHQDGSAAPAGPAERTAGASRHGDPGSPPPVRRPIMRANSEFGYLFSDTEPMDNHMDDQRSRRLDALAYDGRADADEQYGSLMEGEQPAMVRRPENRMSAPEPSADRSVPEEQPAQPSGRRFARRTRDTAAAPADQPVPEPEVITPSEPAVAPADRSADVFVRPEPRQHPADPYYDEPRGERYDDRTGPRRDDRYGGRYDHRYDYRDNYHDPRYESDYGYGYGRDGRYPEHDEPPYPYGQYPAAYPPPYPYGYPPYAPYPAYPAYPYGYPPGYGYPVAVVGTVPPGAAPAVQPQPEPAVQPEPKPAAAPMSAIVAQYSFPEEDSRSVEEEFSFPQPEPAVMAEPQPEPEIIAAPEPVSVPQAGGSSRFNRRSRGTGESGTAAPPEPAQEQIAAPAEAAPAASGGSGRFNRRARSSENSGTPAQAGSAPEQTSAPTESEPASSGGSGRFSRRSRSAETGSTPEQSTAPAGGSGGWFDDPAPASSQDNGAASFSWDDDNSSSGGRSSRFSRRSRS